MKLIVFGATGRVGASFVAQATAAGHDITVYVRDASRYDVSNVKIYEGNILDAPAVARALRDTYDAVVVCIGTRALKASTLVADGMAAILAGMESSGQRRLIGVSGTAEMADKTWFGRVYTAILKRTPVGHAVRDHDAALALLQQSDVEWTLVGCNYLKSGPARGTYKVSQTFPGGFKIIHPPDVASFMLRELVDARYSKRVIGIWY